MKLLNIIVILFLLSFSYHLSSQIVKAGPIVGDVTDHSVRLWCLFSEIDSGNLIISDENGFSKKLFFNEFLFYKPTQKFFIDNLTPNTSYKLTFNLYQQGKFNDTSFTIKTLAKDLIDEFTFVTGSCAFISTNFDRIFDTKKKNRRVFTSMQKEDPDFMIWLGDNIYYLHEYKSVKKMVKKMIKVRQTKELKAFLENVVQYATWDDHDFGPNNAGNSYERKEQSELIFEKSWPNDFNKDEGLYYDFYYQDIHIIMLDVRYFFDDNHIIGAKQMKWLQNKLLTSNGAFKFICSGVQFLNNGSIHESWDNNKGTERQELLDFIVDNKIQNTVFLSGDRHFAELSKFEKDSVVIHDLTTSPLTAFKQNLRKREINTNNVPNTYYHKHNYGKVNISGEEGKRKCTLSLHDVDGRKLWDYTINQRK